MPKVIDSKKYMCNTCNKVYFSADEARICESTHDIVLVPFERADLKRLILFINTGEPRVLTSSLITLLTKYASLRQE